MRFAHGVSLVRGYAAQESDCISAAFGDIPPEAHPPALEAQPAPRCSGAAQTAFTVL